MNVGGVEKSLLNLLYTLRPNEFEIHVGLVFKKGLLLESLPSWIHVHEIDSLQKYWTLFNNPPLFVIRKRILSGDIKGALLDFCLYLEYKFSGTRFSFFYKTLQCEPSFPLFFDAAYSYAGPSQMIDYYICYKVHARHKYGWIHYDVSQFDIDRGMTRRLYKKYEKIFVVSKEAREIFCGIFPEFTSKTEVFYNHINHNLIQQLAESAPTFNDGFTGRRLLTVGRISQEKGQQTAIRAMKLILDKYPKTRWYFVGEGKDLAACQALTHQEGLDNSVVFLGLQKNPYGFMRDCDLYVQPSRHEGYCITLAEALCFEKPVVATSFSGAREQLEGKTDSWIAEFTPESIAASIDSALSSLG